MVKEENFDLSDLLCDSLNLNYNLAQPARNVKPQKPDDYYDKFVLRDPYEILGEKNFRTPEEKIESIRGTPIQEFYRGANVFITGATGFLGKILVEKLIRSVPNIGHIYVLIRSKKGKSSRERFEQLLEDKVFSRMKFEVPDYAGKLTVMDGDLQTPELGLSPKDRSNLLEHINIVFHSAADVRFLEPLRHAVNSNVLGSRRVLQLAKEMKHLWSYVHVSSVYSQCVRDVIEENIPRMGINYNETLNYIDAKSDEELLEETPRILQGWPNTYTFSKALCEEMVQEEGKGIPACIFRPSVVVPTYREPVRGWTDNLYGPTGLLVGAGHGILHCYQMEIDLTVDMVPVDYVVNCMIAAAWKTANKCKSNEGLIVYNFTFTSSNIGFPWKLIVEFSSQQKDVWPFSRAIWYTSFFYTENDYIFKCFWYLLHRIPGACFDKLAELTGNTPGVTKLYQRIENLKSQTDYFSFRQWYFKNNNVMELWQSLTEDDKDIFFFDVRNIDLKEHFLVSKLGVRYYYLKETMESIPTAQRKNTWFKWIHNSLKLTCSVLALKVLVVAARALPF